MRPVRRRPGGAGIHQQLNLAPPPCRAGLSAAISFFLVHRIEDPALARRFGRQLRTTENRCPAGGPVCHAACPDVAADMTTSEIATGRDISAAAGQDGPDTDDPGRAPG
jgi:hypothetical protein